MGAARLFGTGAVKLDDFGRHYTLRNPGTNSRSWP